MGIAIVSMSNKESGRLALVSGANGFIGGHLCHCLLDKGYRVRGMLRKESDASGVPQEVDICHASLDDQNSLDQACTGVDLIFHVAGIAHARSSSVSQFVESNTEGTRKLLAAGRKANVPRFIFFSSILAAKPTSPYGKSKQLAEQTVLESTKHYESVIVLRPVNVYGKGMKGNIAGLIKRIERGSLPPLPRLENCLSLVSVQDLCQAAILAAESDASGGQIYSVTDGKTYTPNTLENAIYAALERKKPNWHSPRAVFYAAALTAHLLNKLGIWNNDLGLQTYNNLIASSEASCEKISNELGYQPSRNFAEEMSNIIA